MPSRREPGHRSGAVHGRLGAGRSDGVGAQGVDSGRPNNVDFHHHHVRPPGEHDVFGSGGSGGKLPGAVGRDVGDRGRAISDQAMLPTISPVARPSARRRAASPSRAPVEGRPAAGRARPRGQHRPGKGGGGEPMAPVLTQQADLDHAQARARPRASGCSRAGEPWSTRAAHNDRSKSAPGRDRLPVRRTPALCARGVTWNTSLRRPAQVLLLPTSSKSTHRGVYESRSWWPEDASMAGRAVVPSWPAWTCG